MSFSKAALGCVDVIIPALNEEASIAKVIAAIPEGLVRDVLVCDNGSQDRTAEVAAMAGAVVVSAPQRGYGSACLAGMAYIAQRPAEQQPEIVVFLDADYSDHPEEMPLLLEAIRAQDYELVIGSRALGESEAGSMTFPQRFGNWLATRLIRWFFGYSFTDLGPFRAIRYDCLLALDMQDPNYGWTVEMQVKAAKQQRRCTEVPVSYRRRIGRSKVSGTVKGTILAGYKILWIIFKYR